MTARGSSFPRRRTGGPAFPGPRGGRRPGRAWAAAWLAGVVLVVLGAVAGLWFTPFVIGAAAGVATRRGGLRLRSAVPAVAAIAVIGWGLVLWWPALRGEPAGGTARVIAALAGLPAQAAVGFAAALLVALLQALAGCWLGRALTPRPAR